MNVLREGGFLRFMRFFPKLKSFKTNLRHTGWTDKITICWTIVRYVAQNFPIRMLEEKNSSAVALKGINHGT